jgi:methylase of polypeptide subunit release factors
MTTTPAEPSTSQFGPLSVSFDHRVLAPRLWTLLQSDWAAELVAGLPCGPLLELCAGAGHIGQAAALLSGHDLVQVELNPAAADFAVANAARAGLGDRVDVRQCSLDVALRPGEVFSLVLADPPYLPTSHLSRWPDDPTSAIDGGPDGLDVVRRCLRVASQHMTSGAVLLLQVAGDSQAHEVIDLVSDSTDLGLQFVETRRHDAERAVMALTRT